jgi:hypothetical protein
VLCPCQGDVPHHTTYQDKPKNNSSPSRRALRSHRARVIFRSCRQESKGEKKINKNSNFKHWILCGINRNWLHCAKWETGIARIPRTYRMGRALNRTSRDPGPKRGRSMLVSMAEGSWWRRGGKLAGNWAVGVFGAGANHAPLRGLSLL